MGSYNYYDTLGRDSARNSRFVLNFKILSCLRLSVFLVRYLSLERLSPMVGFDCLFHRGLVEELLIVSQNGF